MPARQIELEEEEAALDMDDDAAESKSGSRMLRDEVTPDDIASVVASWTGDLYVFRCARFCIRFSPTGSVRLLGNAVDHTTEEDTIP